MGAAIQVEQGRGHGHHQPRQQPQDKQER